MFVLLGRVELEGLETDGDADLRVGVHHPGVGLDTVPSRERRGNLGSVRSLLRAYLLGAVVFILKQTFLAEGFFNFM